MQATKSRVRHNEMSAAPLLSSTQGQDDLLSHYPKRGRWDGYTSGATIIFDDPSHGLENSSQLRMLQNDYPDQTIPFLISVLEASGGRVEAARLVLAQIHVLKGSRSNRGHQRKRHLSCDTRSDDSSEEGPVEAQEPAQPAAADQLVDNVVTEVLSSTSVDDMRRRLKPRLESAVMVAAKSLSNVSGGQPDVGLQNAKLQNVLTRTIVNQANVVTSLKAKVAQVMQERNTFATEASDSRRVNEELRRELKTLRDMNSRLSYYIASLATSSDHGRPDGAGNGWTPNRDVF